MNVDIRWQSAGGFLLDGSGDIATTDPSVPESLVDMIQTVLKADRNSWQLYTIGANLSRLMGELVDPELELKIKRQITESIVRAGILRQENFQVETIASEKSILAIVYINGVAASVVNIPQNKNEKITVQ